MLIHHRNTQFLRYYEKGKIAWIPWWSCVDGKKIPTPKPQHKFVINTKDSEEYSGRHKKTTLKVTVVTGEMEQKFLAMKSSMKNRNMTKQIYFNRSVKQNIVCFLCIRTMGVHMVGYSLQITASMEQPGGSGLVLKVRKDTNNFLFQLPLQITTHYASLHAWSHGAAEQT